MTLIKDVVVPFEERKILEQYKTPKMCASESDWVVLKKWGLAGFVCFSSSGVCKLSENGIECLNW